MKKELPKAKKSLKTFILDEDAKIIDKTATKIAITASFMAISMMANAQDANAKGHSNHSNHQNMLNAPNNYGTGIHGGNNPLDVETNQITEKNVETYHNNHYNHQDASGGYGGFGAIIGAIVAVALTWVTGGASLAMYAAVAGAGAAVGGTLMPTSGEVGAGINSGAPHQVPEEILTLLKEENN